MAADLSRIMDKVIDFNKYALALYTTIAGAVLALFLTYSAFEDSDIRVVFSVASQWLFQAIYLSLISLVSVFVFYILQDLCCNKKRLICFFTCIAAVSTVMSLLAIMVFFALMFHDSGEMSLKRMELGYAKHVASDPSRYYGEY